MAHKKAGGSTSNVRDSQSKRLGIKKSGGQQVIPGNIIVRQKGSRFYPSVGTKAGKDHTIYAITDGIVLFSNKKVKNFTGKLVKRTYVSIGEKAAK